MPVGGVLGTIRSQTLVAFSKDPTALHLSLSSLTPRRLNPDMVLPLPYVLSGMEGNNWGQVFRVRKLRSLFFIISFSRTSSFEASVLLFYSLNMFSFALRAFMNLFLCFANKYISRHHLFIQSTHKVRSQS